MTVKSCRDLDVWQDAMVLAEDVYALSNHFPRDERFGLTAQVRRASVSVPSCIAEGHARYSSRDFARFIAMAAGSNAEVETQLMLASRLGYVGADAVQPVIERTQRIGRMLRGLRKALDNKLASADSTPAPSPSDQPQPKSPSTQPFAASLHPSSHAPGPTKR